MNADAHEAVEVHGDRVIRRMPSGRSYFITGPGMPGYGRWFQKIEKARAFIALEDSMHKCLYVDDIRPCPEGWDLARNFHEAIVMLEATEYAVVSLDHDIASYYGNKEMTGRDILNWLIARKMEGGHVPETVKVHSANPVGCATMEADIERYWGR